MTLHCIAFVSMFIVGGLSGIFMAAVPVDIYIHDTYIIVAHFHYVVFGTTMFGVFGAIQFWFPKMFGRKMNETVGKWHFLRTLHELGYTGPLTIEREIPQDPERQKADIGQAVRLLTHLRAKILGS